ncbi:MAG: hypothetical protein CMJ35_11410 [Phycisphaerae bacterium]|nr:hypothetical protein [Phycisphaerae bacterium]
MSHDVKAASVYESKLGDFGSRKSLTVAADSRSGTETSATASSSLGDSALVVTNTTDDSEDSSSLRQPVAYENELRSVLESCESNSICSNRMGVSPDSDRTTDMTGRDPAHLPSTSAISLR